MSARSWLGGSLAAVAVPLTAVSVLHACRWPTPPGSGLLCRVPEASALQVESVHAVIGLVGALQTAAAAILAANCFLVAAALKNEAKVPHHAQALIAWSSATAVAGLLYGFTAGDYSAQLLLQDCPTLVTNSSIATVTDWATGCITTAAALLVAAAATTLHPSPPQNP